MNRLQLTYRFLSVVLLAAFVAMMAGCGSSSSKSGNNSGPKRKGTADTLNSFNNAGDADWVKTLDPCCVTDSISISDISMVNANLVKASYPSLKIVPDLATWKISPDHKTYTFTINSKAKFADGHPVTAQDAAWSITRSLLPATKSPVATTYLGHVVGAKAVAAGKTTTLTGVKVLNAHQLQITLDAPISYFLGTLSYPTADVLEKSVLQGKPSGYLTNSCSANVGAGPYKFVCLNKSSSKSSFYPGGHSPYMKFAPNPNYFGAKPTVKVYSPFMADTEANWKNFLSGGVDGSAVPTSAISQAKSMKGFSKTPLLETDYITPNQQLAPFNNLHCRLAVSYAIDRESITKKLLHGTEGPLYAVVPPGLLSHFGKSSDVPSYNPTRAKKELSQCPGKLQGVTLTYQNTGADITHEYDAVRANLQAIGANITTKPLTFNQWLNVVGQSMQATKTQITENLWIDDYPDPQDWVDNLLHSGANYNIGGFKNAQYDKLVDQGNVEFNTTKRGQLYTQAQKIALNNGAWIGVGYGYGTIVISPKVKNLIFTPGYPAPVGNDWSKVTISG